LIIRVYTKYSFYLQLRSCSSIIGIISILRLSINSNMMVIVYELENNVNFNIRLIEKVSLDMSLALKKKRLTEFRSKLTIRYDYEMIKISRWVNNK
jgi:hypothetical protein